jgi:M-phase inducer tyrosine phosphatase
MTGLQGLGASSASFLKRPRRPVLSAMVQPSDHHIQSAFPILSPPSTTESDDHSPRGSAPMRHAFSAFLPPSVYTDLEPDEESSFEVQDMSSPA